MRILVPGVSKCMPSGINEYSIHSGARQPEDQKAVTEPCLASIRAASSPVLQAHQAHVYPLKTSTHLPQCLFTCCNLCLEFPLPQLFFLFLKKKKLCVSVREGCAYEGQRTVSGGLFSVGAQDLTEIFRIVTKLLYSLSHYASPEALVEPIHSNVFQLSYP